MSPRIVLHHLNVSRSDRIFWALEELGLPYDVQVYFRLPTRSAPPSLKQITPFGKAPALQLNNETLTESAYIITRLLQVAPESAKDSIEVVPTNDDIYWAHFAEGSQMSTFVGSVVAEATSSAFVSGQVGGLNEAEREGVKRYASWLTGAYYKPQNQNNLDQMEAFLAGRPRKFFSGTEKPGMGDFMIFFLVNSLQNGTRKNSGYTIGPATLKWFETISARPALQRAMDRLAKEEESAKAKM